MSRQYEHLLFFLQGEASNQSINCASLKAKTFPMEEVEEVVEVVGVFTTRDFLNLVLSPPGFSSSFSTF